MKLLRTKLGLTQAQFAVALGVQERTIYRWEDGSSEPTGTAADAIGAIVDAIEEGGDPRAIGRIIIVGVRRLLYQAITA
jgi:DNA-binding XRE family transcriptional regulator